jgi:hypothetical protein
MPLLRPPRVSSSSPPLIQGLRPRIISYFRFSDSWLPNACVCPSVRQGGGRASPVPQHVGPRQGRVSARLVHARLIVS